jgi:hypothetical protein
VVDKRATARAGSGDVAPELEKMSPQPEEVPAQKPPPSETPAPEAGPSQVWTPEQEAEARRIAEEIARTPALEWVVNSAVTLANVAATKLDAGNLPDAQVAIDAVSGIVKEVGSRLGSVEKPLRQTLSQLQMAYAELISTPDDKHAEGPH